METIKEVIEDVVTKGRGFYEKNIPDNARDTEFGLQSTLVYMDIRDGKYTEDDAVDVVNRLNIVKKLNKKGILLPFPNLYRNAYTPEKVDRAITNIQPRSQKIQDLNSQYLVMGPIPALGMPYIDSGWIFYDPQATIWSYAKKKR